MAFYFFTGENSINSSQTLEMSFGPISDDGNIERYNLENKFSISIESPLYSITKSLVIAIEDPTNSSLLNIALLPIEENYLAGFPIKLFIFRGILKSSILNTDNTVKIADNSWNNNNILNIIHELQDKINQLNGTLIIPTSEYLGLQFSNLSNETSIESLFHNHLDNFQPLIVPGGCQLGKFAGGSNFVGVEIIFDKIGEDLNINILKSQEHIFEIEKIDLVNIESEREKLKILFKNRIEKEKVLGYMDITAFYGSCINQGYRIKGVSNNTNFLNYFYNKDVVYIDIRDEKGFSYNHFFKLNDEIKIGFYDGVNEDPIFENYNYYNIWPIVALRNIAFQTNKKFIFLNLPLLIGQPVETNIITSYTKNVSIGESKKNIRSFLLGEYDKNGNIVIKTLEDIRLKNWSFDDNKLGVNYFLIKIDRIQSIENNQIYSQIWNSFFPLNMKHSFDYSNLNDGEFIVKTYSSINSPLILNKVRNEIYSPTIGIAADKFHITFFSFYKESISKFYKRTYHTVNLIETGKFKYPIILEELNYTSPNQAVGFLYQISKNDRISNKELSIFKLTDPENQISELKALKYINRKALTDDIDILETLDSITFTHDEYNALKDIESNILTDTDFIAEHPLYIRSKSLNFHEYKEFTINTFNITLGILKIVGDESVFSMEIVEYPNNILVNSEEISITSIDTN